MSGLVERRCSLLLFQLNSESGVKIDELSQKLETGTDSEKIAALKKIIHCIIAGIDLTRLTMQVIKFCLRSKSHEMKKLLQIYWEVLDKKDGKTGKLKPEMILVCNHLLQDLQHANGNVLYIYLSLFLSFNFLCIRIHSRFNCKTFVQNR